MTAQALSVRGLCKRYRDGTEANRGIDMDVRAGEVVSILGPNGAGKTTFLRQVTTELRPTAGSVRVFDVDAVASPARAKSLMGITPQEAGVFDRLNVREHLELFARLKGIAKRDARAAALEVAEELGLGAEFTKRVGDLSGGQRRRVLVGLALLGRPPLLVLDEPTTGLDPASRRAVWGVIRRASASGSTVILSTHYIEEAERLSDRVAVILAGQLVALGTLEELLGRLEKSYRVSYRDPLDPEGETRTRYFASFAEARRHVEGERLSEYSMARASLEDVYFALTGHHIEAEELEEEACGV
ncbi:MAG TPA: ABC transporter ATP-binding protein [Pyrinomonadaceae bacterium]|jgi:ABC-type multidrug transport system ATPase subunit|nr:ABC transporter ATP-binding protein [Pyrinomonadaceae bacterium]